MKTQIKILKKKYKKHLIEELEKGKEKYPNLIKDFEKAIENVENW